MRCRSAFLAAAAMACVLAAAGALAAPDYAREDRWAAQVAPMTVVGDVVYLSTPSRPRVLALWTEALSAKGGVVLIHGQGVHPDWGLIGALRSRLADAGLSTLSVQMPLLAADAPREGYAALEPEANARIAAAIAFVRSHHVQRVAIVAHSMGASMANAYLATPGAARIDAFVPIGMWGDFAIMPREPVLDVIAADDFPQVRESAPLRHPTLPRDGCSKRVIIAGTDHYMDNRHAELASALLPFLQRAFDGGCK
jgi:pimeloyl-ACP methyl ester carboxylesterase